VIGLSGCATVPPAIETIHDVEMVCREHAVLCEPARGGGSHYKVAILG
jgi:hypothetical protein